jgi:DNA-directed RNA polymerase specialized sigma24 family protein
MNTDEYRQNEYFVRDREIWKYRFIENWSLKTISTFFDISVQEIKEIIAKQELYFQEEYE